MRRPALALALLACALVATAQQGSTAGSTLPTSTAVYRSTSVTGGTLLSLGYSVTNGSVTAVKPELRGDGLIKTLVNVNPKTVTVRFGDDVPVTCTQLTSSLLDALTGAGEATYDCLGLLERADRPAPLTITVS